MKRRPAAVVLGVALACGASVAGASTAGSSAPVAGTFVGKVSHTSALIAVVAGRASGGSAKRRAVAYICDGQQVSTWFFGQASANTLDLVSKHGEHVHVTLSAGRAVGTVDVPGGGSEHFAAVPARGVAGIYLVNHSQGHVTGFSGRRARLKATVRRASNGAFKITGTVTPRGGAPVTIKRAGRFGGGLKFSATWIVLADGQITGATPENIDGAGNCSIWSKIKQIMFGVFCGFFKERTGPTR